MTWPQSEVQFLPGPLMGPTWELIDKIGIILGIGAIALEGVVAFWVWQTQQDVEEMQEDVEDIQEDLDEDDEASVAQG